ncbi:MAG: ABC transporter ATP-binding protein [Kiritimatiellae bacterium]|nr:ABC transporter ATP-binding protein [Kiritimatiellia bacterium]MDD4735716.1 ABC transporter ATP-binding protein [Kiritimatiellia bacterium]
MIRTIKLNKYFGAFHAVNDLNIEVNAGELFCFLGPNGAGKTTTIKMLCGLLRPTSGDIEMAGVNLNKDPLSIRRQCGYIPDQPFLYERLTPVEYCEFICDLFRIPLQEARNAMNQYFEILDLNDYRSHLIKELSHGLRQRLLYAATLIHRPNLIFVDEPFVGLDPYSIRTIRSLLREQIAQGATIFLTTHILSLAEELADRVAIIHQGSLVDCGTLKELKQRHASEGNLENLFLDLTMTEKRS